MRTARPGTGNDLVPETTEVHDAEFGAVVPMDELDVELDKGDDCEHVYWYTEGGPEMDRRLYALEPDPHTGYWTCCPRCGFVLGQKNVGAIPPGLRTL